MNSFDELRARPAGRAQHAKQDRKLKQLCRQVQRTLSLAIGGELADPMLSELWVEEVRPAPDAGRLCVRLRVPQRGASVAEIHRRLEAVEGFLRAEIARAITRKRAPQLTFELIWGSKVAS
jgi:ribosome-binding factor A